MTNSLNFPLNPTDNSTHTQFGITYTYDAANDVWTTSTPATINDMTDVDINTVPPTDNQILSWDASANKFIPSA